MKRLCIFSFFDSKGVVDKSVEYLLNELYQNMDRIVIAVNGEIEESGRKKLEAYTKDILVRENLGYDAGAYKCAMFDYLKVEEIKQYDELILCNDTFIGPFIPFRDIFSEMEKRPCDFWGMTAVDWKFLPVIQSYFLVFNKTIICDDSFFAYWKESIDEYTDEVEDVYAQFEMGLFYYLSQVKKKNHSTYITANNCNFFTSVSVSIKKYALPLLKKKALKNFSDNKDDVIDAVQYIAKRNGYPINYILDYIERFCGVSLSEEQICSYAVDKRNIKELPYIETEITTEELKVQLDACKEFYIYGCGAWARRIYWNLCRDNKNFKGFLISDIRGQKHDTLYGYEVRQIDKAVIDDTCKIVLGVNKENAKEILNKYKSYISLSQVLSLFPDTLREDG